MRKKYEVIHDRAKIQIGKKGLSQNIIAEIKNILKKDGYVKIRINRNYFYGEENSKAKKQELIELLKREGLKIVDVRGNTITVKLSE